MSLGAYLTIDGAAAAIEFYKAAFGAEEVSRLPTEDGTKVMHAELRLFGGTLMLSDAIDGYPEPKSPKALGGTTFNLIVGLDRGPDVDAAVAKAVAQGATVTMPPEDMFWGDRFAMLRDPFGHMWGFNAPAKG